MPPDRGRASRACASCRKQKTRCYEPGTPGRACLRCERLQQKCSLALEAGSPGEERQQEQQQSQQQRPVPSLDTDIRLERLEKTVATLLDRLGEGPSSADHELSRPSSVLTTPDPGSQTYQGTESAAAPIMVIRDLANDARVEPSPETRSLGAALNDIISPDLALTLLSIFLEHYGRWIIFRPESDPVALLPRVRRSPILFCACCLIAIRHVSEELAANLAPKLYEFARSLVSSMLLTTPQSVDFFQAALILCMWSTTVGQVPLSIDSWLLSGFALQHSLSSPIFATITSQSHRYTKMDEVTLDHICLWNHLCLAHLHYCVGTSRRSTLQAWQIERCETIIGSDHASNFEVRMVAEIQLYWTVYGYLIDDSAELHTSTTALKAWKKKWSGILEQPRSQFLIMGFHFSNLLLYEHALKAKVVHGRDHLVSEMVRHSTAIVHLAMNTVDERTRHLSDHIYHMITFAAIIICRLLNSYATQLRSTFNTAELDSLVLSLVQWLHSIGLPCHAAHTLGNIIAKVHQKLRPHVEAVPVIAPTDEFLPEESFTSYYFPEFLGLGPSADGTWDLLSDLSFLPQASSNS